MDELVSELGLGVNLFQIFMIWIGYTIVRTNFTLNRSPEIPHRVSLVQGIIPLSIGLLPIDFIGYISVFTIVVLVWAHYLDSKELKSYQFSSKEIPVKKNKSGFSSFTWDMWIVTIVCFFLAIYYMILIFNSILSDINIIY